MKTRKLWTTAMAAFMIAAFIGGCKDENVETVGLCPLVISTNPANLATNVPLNQVISVTFNEAMNPLTITPGAFSLTSPGSGRVDGTAQMSAIISGTLTYDATTFSMNFVPTAKLKSNTTYTGVVATSVKDVAGNALQVAYIWTFSTGATVAPTVVTTDPANTATKVVLDKIITADFSVPMDPLTLIATTFTIKQGVTAVVGTVSYAGTKASFTPTNQLAPNTLYTGTITTGAKNAAGTPLVADYVFTFTTGSIPTVTSTDPANVATLVALNKIVIATFSEPMDTLTLIAANYSLKMGTTAVAGTVTFTGSTAVFTPSSALLSNTIYTATVTTGAKNVAGIPMASNYVWTFTTGSIVAPTVISTDPLNLAINVATNKVISANFSEAIDPLTITASTFTLKIGTTSVVGAVGYSGTTATFTPSSNLLSGTTYIATITTGAKNLAGIPLANDYVWSFNTPALIAPTVTSTDPINLANGVGLNKVLTANFSEAMDPLTITSSFTLKTGVTSVLGVVTYSGTTATFTPSANLLAGTAYTATITVGAKNLAGTAIASDFVWSFNTSLAPTVISNDPLNLATGVTLNKILTANFSEAMDALTITTSTFTVKDGVTPVLGVVGYSGTAATFTPNINLLPGKVYTATVTIGAKNLAGIPLASDHVWSFTAGASPTVISTDPLNLATGVALNKILTANFSVAMDALTITTSTFTLKDGVTPVLGVVGYSGTAATFTPNINLLPGKVYTATVTTGAKNPIGIPVAIDFVWTFTTVAPIPPTVILTDPINLATSVALNKVISANFSEAMDPSTISTLTFTLKIGVTPVTGVVNYSGTTATFTPTSSLLSDATYTATITTGAKNLAGTSLASDFVWTFSTVPHLGPLAVDLKTVARFGIIAGVGVSNNAGFSVINDLDVGISPGVRSSVTGFPPATIVNGDIYASDDIAPPGTAAMLTQAKQDLTDAYLFAEGATSPAPATVAGNQGGLTLAPGIYKSGSTLSIDGSPLTLDAQGDVNAVWIFQIAAGFTTTTGGSVILIGGAKAKNIFWQVGSSAVIGDNTSFKGTVLALSSITMNTNAVAEGRMLARNAAVVMTSTNIINKPSN